MARKKDDNFVDSLFEDELNTEGMASHQYNYTSLGSTTAVLEKSKTKAERLIKSIAKIYFDSGEIDNEAYVKVIQDVECMTLESLFMQVFYSQHMLSTLMDRLDQGEHCDNSIYHLIMEVQNNQLKLTLQVSQHFRNLPTFFKHVQKELMESGQLSTPILSTNSVGGASQEKLLPDGQLNIAVPHRGMRDLLMQLEKEESDRASLQDIEEIPIISENSATENNTESSNETPS